MTLREAGGSCHRGCLRSDGCVTHSPDSQPELLRAGFGGPTPPPRRGNPGATHPTVVSGFVSDVNGRFMPAGGRTLRLIRAMALCALTLVLSAEAGWAAEGMMTWGVHVSLTPAFFDPADATGTALPLMVYYAIHDALVRPLPGQRMGAALAQSWEASRDGLTYDFTLRKGVHFQNGDPVTADDVKFSFERYRGASAGLLKARVASVEIMGPQRVRFRLKQPWPDFMTFYATPATGAAWIVPRKYVEKVGDEGYKKAPVGAGPYKL